MNDPTAVMLSTPYITLGVAYASFAFFPSRRAFDTAHVDCFMDTRHPLCLTANAQSNGRANFYAF